jgi:alpha-L-rhamnosidase
MGETVAAGFNDAFYDPDAGRYDPGTQSAQAIPLYFGMVPDDAEADVLSSLVEKLTAEDDRALQTGFLGTRPLIHTLVDHGHAELAWDVVTRSEKPGWVYMAEQGATTMWERWDSDDRVGDGMNSLNHSPFTHVSEWFYEVLAGIRVEAETPLTEHVTIAPTVVDDLEWASGSVETPNGDLESRWERTEDGLALSCTVPWNTSATVRVPGGARADSGTGGGRSVRLDGEPLNADGASGVQSVRTENGDLLVEVGSGEYQFTRQD